MNHKEELNVDEGLRGNEQIEEAIAALQQEPSQEMLAHTLTCIRRRMNENGQVIIAVEPPVGDQGMQVQAVQTDDGANWDVYHLPLVISRHCRQRWVHYRSVSLRRRMVPLLLFRQFMCRQTI